MTIDDGLYVSGSVTIPAAEIELTAIRSQGAGGQNVNKVASAVQLHFDAARSSALSGPVRARLLALRDHRISADGVVVIKAQQFRSQEQNKAAAFERLAELRLLLRQPACRLGNLIARHIGDPTQLHGGYLQSTGFWPAWCAISRARRDKTTGCGAVAVYACSVRCGRHS